MSEFLRDPRTHAPPQSFRMGDLLHEMKDIEQRNLHHTPVRGVSHLKVSVYPKWPSLLSALHIRTVDVDTSKVYNIFWKLQNYYRLWRYIYSNKKNNKLDFPNIHVVLYFPKYWGSLIKVFPVGFEGEDVMNIAMSFWHLCSKTVSGNFVACKYSHLSLPTIDEGNERQLYSLTRFVFDLQLNSESW